MAGVGPSSISFGGLKASYVAGGGTDASGNSSLRDEETNTSISLSDFRNAVFTNGTTVSASGEISINDDFKGKTFKSSGNNFVTANFNFNDDFSGESDRLYPVSSASSTTAQTSSEHKIARLFHSNVTYAYPSILLCPQPGEPTIETEDDAEVWIKMKLNTPFHFQIGIIHKHQSSWANLVTNALRVRHATYNDRISLHTYGYIIHAGHDVESSTKVDELTEGTITNETTTSNYHNRIGTTAGSGNGFGTVASTYYYLQSDVDFYQSKTSITSEYYIGMKVNYYEITLTGNITDGSSTISNIQLSGAQLTDTDNVYSGMYLSSDDSDFPSTSTIIQSISYSSSTSLIMGNELIGSTTVIHSGTTKTVTFKAFGQRLEFQYTDDSFTQPKNIGPNHIILPRKYRTSSSGSNLDIDSWAFFVGDSTGGSNTGIFTIKDSNPSLYPDISASFIEISNRFISATSSSDYTGAYDVSETGIGLSGNYQIYIGIKITASTTFYNDISVAGVQVLDSSNNVKQTWIFNTTSGDNWQTYTSQISGSSTIGFPITPQTASGYSYSNITTLTGTTAQRVGKFSYASSTGSSYTGTAGGISGSTGEFTVGNATISQVGSSYYLYREASGSSRYSGTVMRSPSITLASGDKIRIAHLMVGSSNSQMSANDSIYLGAYNTG